MGIHDDIVKKLKRTDSASTSNLAQKKSIQKDSKISRLRRLSPNLFKSKPGAAKTEKDNLQDKSSKLNSKFIDSTNKVQQSYPVPQCQ